MVALYFFNLVPRAFPLKNSRLSTIPQSPKSRLYIALFKRRNKPQNVLNISGHFQYGLRYAVHLNFSVCLMKSLKNMPESLETMTDFVRLRPLL